MPAYRFETYNDRPTIGAPRLRSRFIPETWNRRRLIRDAGRLVLSSELVISEEPRPRGGHTNGTVDAKRQEYLPSSLQYLGRTILFLNQDQS